MADEQFTTPASRTVTLAGRGSGAMSFLDFGAPDRPVDAVFLHANGFNALTYRHVLAPLARRYRILAPDQRGHGSTSLPAVVEGRRDWLDLRDDLLAFLQALDLTDVVLGGHSMGATACLLAAAVEPPCSRALVLFDPVMPAWPWAPSSEPGIVRAARRRRAVFPSRAEALKSYRGRGAFSTWPESILADYVEAGFQDLPDGQVTLICTPAWEASSYGAQDHDSWVALSRSTCPIDIFRAESASTFQAGASLDDLGGRVRIITAPGTTHFLPMERPDFVQSALAAAIEPPVSAQTRTSVQA